MRVLSLGFCKSTLNNLENSFECSTTYQSKITFDCGVFYLIPRFVNHVINGLRSPAPNFDTNSRSLGLSLTGFVTRLAMFVSAGIRVNWRYRVISLFCVNFVFPIYVVLGFLFLFRVIKKKFLGFTSFIVPSLRFCDFLSHLEFSCCPNLFTSNLVVSSCF